MTATTIAGHDVEVNDEGFFERPEQWREDMVPELARLSGVPVKELYELFPRGPAKVAAKIAGIPKPRGCV